MVAHAVDITLALTRLHSSCYVFAAYSQADGMQPEDDLWQDNDGLISATVKIIG